MLRFEFTGRGGAAARAAVLAVALGAVAWALAPMAAFAADMSGGVIVLAQAQDQDRDRDRDRDHDWTQADRDRIRDRLRDASCQDTVDATDEVVLELRSCLDRERLRDGGCIDMLRLGEEALERTRERCRGS